MEGMGSRGGGRRRRKDRRRRVFRRRWREWVVEGEMGGGGEKIGECLGGRDG